MAEEIDDLPVLKKSENGSFEKVYSQGDDLPVFKKKEATAPSQLNTQTTTVSAPSTEPVSQPSTPSEKSGGGNSIWEKAKSFVGKIGENIQSGYGIFGATEAEKTNREKAQARQETANREYSRKLESQGLNQRETEMLKQSAISKQDEILADYKKVKEESNAVEFAMQFPEYGQLVQLDSQISAIGEPKTNEQISAYNELVNKRNELLNTDVSDRDVFRESAPIFETKQPSDFDTMSDYVAYQKDMKKKFDDFTSQKKKFEQAQQKYATTTKLRDVIDVAQKSGEQAQVLSQKIKADQKIADENIAAVREINADKLEPLGFGKGFMEGMEQTTLSNTVADIYLSGDDEKLAKTLENIYAESVMFPRETTAGGMVGELIGGQVKPMAVGFGLGAVNPAVGIAGGSAYYGRMGIGGGLMEAYSTARAQGMDMPTALELAKKQAAVGGATGAAEGLAGMITFGGKPMATLATKGFRKVVGEALKDNAVDAAVAGAMKVVQNKNMQRLGLDVETDSGVLEEMGAEMAFGAGMHLAMYGGSKIKGYGTLINGIAKMPFSDIQLAVDNAVQSGVLDAAKGGQFLRDVAQSSAAQGKLKGIEIPEGAEDEVVDLQKQIDVLEKDKETASPAIVPGIEAKVEDLSAKLQIAAAIPLTSKEKGELNKLQTARDENKTYDKDRLNILEERQVRSEQIIKDRDAAMLAEEQAKIKQASEGGAEVELQPTITKTEQNAEEQQSGQMREQGVQNQTEGSSDSNMPIVNEAELQDGQIVEEVARGEVGLEPTVTDAKTEAISEDAGGDVEVVMKDILSGKKPVYHGTFANFEEFDPSKLGSNTGAASSKEGFFFASNKKVAESYVTDNLLKGKGLQKQADDATKELEKLTGDTPIKAGFKITQKFFNDTETGWDEKTEGRVRKLLDKINAYDDFIGTMDDSYFAPEGKVARSGKVKETYLDIKNPFIKDYKGEKFRDEKYSEVIKKAKAAGHDGVIFKNTFDGNDKTIGDEPTDIYVVFDKSQIKSKAAKQLTPAEAVDVEAQAMETKPKNKTQQLRELKEVNDKLKVQILKAEPTTPYEWLLQYFASGGKINTADLKKETGFGGNDARTGKGRNMEDFRKRIWMHRKDAPSIDRLTEQLQEDWRTNYGEDEIDWQDARNMIIDIMTSFDTPRAIYEDLRNSFSVGERGVVTDRNERMYAKQEEEIARQYEAYQSSIENIADESLDEAADIIDEIDNRPITEEEIEREASAYEEYFNSLSEEEKQKELNILSYEKDTTNEGTEGEENAQDKGISQAKAENQQKLEEAKRALSQAEAEYNATRNAVTQDLSAKQTDMFRGKEQKLFDDTAEMQKRSDAAKANVDAAREEVNRLQDLVDEDMDGQQKLDLNEASEIEAAKQAFKDALKGFNDASDITKLGIAGNDPKAQAEALYKVHQALVRLAKAYIAKGISDIKKFASAAGITAKQAKQAWDEATGVAKYTADDLQYDIADLTKTAIRRGISAKSLMDKAIAKQKDKTRNVTKAIKAITAYVNEMSDRGNLTRGDLMKIINLIPSVKDQASLDRVAEKIYQIIDNATSDKIEVSEKQALKSQIRAEVKAAKEGYRAAKLEQREYAQAIKDFMDDANINAALTQREIKALVKKAANVSSETQLNNFIDYAQKIIDNADYISEMEEVGNMQSKARKRNHVSFNGIVKEFTSIKPELIPDNLLVAYKSALDGLMSRTPSYKGMEEIFYEIATANQTPDTFSNIKTYQEAQELYNSIALNKVTSVEEYRSLFKDINGFKRRVEQLFENGDITEQERDDLVAQVGKDQGSVEAKYASEITSLKTDLINEIRAKQKSTGISQLSAEEKKLLERFYKLDNNELRSLSPEELYNLSSILDNVMDEGRVDVFRLSPLVNRAEAAEDAKELASQVGKAKPFTDIQKSVKEMVKKLGMTYSSFWESQLGLGSVEYGAFQKYVVAPMERALGNYRREVQDAFKNFNDLKKKYGVTSEEQMNKIGIVATYLREYGMSKEPEYTGKKDSKGNEFGTRDWFEFMLTDPESRARMNASDIKALQKIYDKLPKLNGKVSPEDVYDSFVANDGRFLSQKETDFLKETMEWRDKNMTGKQKYANELRGKPFEQVMFHIKRVRKDDTNLPATTPVEVSQRTGNVRIAAGSGKEVTNNELGGVETNFEKLFAETVEENARDYYMTPMLQKQNDVLNAAKDALPNDKKSYIEVMKNNLASAVNSEFEDAKANRVATNLLRAKAAQVLIAPIRTIGEGVAAIVSYPARAGAMNAYAELFKKKDVVKSLMSETNSPYQNRVDLSRQFDVQKGTIKGEGWMQKASELFAALPERMGIEPVWMAVFNNSFKRETGTDFDRQKYMSDPQYAQKYRRAIQSAGATADATYGQIAGSTTRAGSRREIKILPSAVTNTKLAKVLGIPESLESKSTMGTIAAFMTGYPFREVEQLVKSGRTILEAAKDAEYTKADVAKGVAAPIGIALSAMTYNYWQAMSYQLSQLVTGDDEEKKKAKEDIDKLFTSKTAILEGAATLVSTLGSRYSGFSRTAVAWLGSLYYNLAENEEEKQVAKDFVRNITYKNPFELKKKKSGEIDKYLLREKIAYQETDALAPLAVINDNAYKAAEAVGGLDYLQDKISKGQALTEPEKEALVLAYVAVNYSNAVTQFFGYGVPNTVLNKLAKGAIDKGKSDAKSTPAAPTPTRTAPFIPPSNKNIYLNLNKTTK